MSQIIPASVESAFNGFNTMFDKGFSSAAPFWSQVAMLINSSREQETYAWPDLLPGLREWVGPRLYRDVMARAQVLVNKKYELSFKLDISRFEDDSLGLFNAQAQMMGESAAKHPDVLMAALIEDAHNLLCHDGQEYFDGSHPIDPSGEVTASTQSNLFTTTALSAANLQATWAAMANYKGRDNKPMGVNPRLLMIPPALRKTALEIANAEYTGSTAGSNVLKGSVDILINPYLTSATTWYLMDTSKAIKPFVWQLRQAPKTTIKTSDSDDNVFEEDVYKYGMKMRGAAGLGLYFLAAKCTA